jgi:hypothetical protein
MFLHRNIHKYTWNSPDGKTHNQIDHILIDKRWPSSIVDIQGLKRGDCDNDHYLVVAKLRETMVVSKQAAQNFNGERFNGRKLSELEVRKQYQIKISNRFAAIKNLNDSKEIYRVWDNINENIKRSAKRSLGLHELKQHNLWFV